jgi:hypothetical protein
MYNSLVNTTGLKTSFTDVASLVNTLLPYLFYGSGIALLIYLVFGGIQLMLSQGEPKAMEGAKNKITGAVIGFVIIFVAYWLVLLIGRILGIGVFENIFANNPIPPIRPH